MRGGKREGAGRPKTDDPRVARTVSMPARYWDWLDEQPHSRGRVVQMLIEQEMVTADQSPPTE